MESVESLFDQEVREKKRSKHYHAARRRTGVSSSKGGVRTQYDFLNKEEKASLNGEVTSFNMYDTIISKQEFDMKEDEQQRTLLERWRELYPNRKIAEEMGIPDYKVYELVNKLGIKKRIVTKEKQPKKKKAAPEVESAAISQAPIPQVEQPSLVTLIEPGERHEYNGTYKGNKLVNRLEKLLLLLDGEDETDFQVSILITEKTGKGE